jgi:hypothetical protein
LFITLSLWRYSLLLNKVKIVKKLLLLMSIFVLPINVFSQDYGYQNNPPAPQEYQRDPFTTSDMMYAQTGMQPGERASVYGGFIPGYGASAQGAPKMRLKGYVTKNVSKATALLEIEGAGVYMVSEGDEIGLHAIGSSGVLKVIEVGPNGVKVQSGRINQVIIVR